MKNTCDTESVFIEPELEDLFLNESMEYKLDVDDEKDGEIDDFFSFPWWLKKRKYDVLKAKKENPKYEKSHWGKSKNKIASFLQLEEINSSSVEFSDAVFEWQTIYGFNEKNRNGILDPTTWKRMRRCTIKNPCRFCSKPIPASSPWTAERIQSLRSNIVKVARTEWDKWHHPKRLKEYRGKGSCLVKQYWLEGVNIKRKLSDLKDSSYQNEHPWSAAFISWVIKRAGAGTDFKYHQRHTCYIYWSKMNAIKKNDNPFKAYRINKRKPEPGDIVFRNRGKGKGQRFENLKYWGSGHCDIVTDVKNSYITVVGGNVGSVVGKTRIYLDSRGFIDTNEHNKHIAIVKIVPTAPSSTNQELEVFFESANSDSDFLEESFLGEAAC